MKQDKRKTTESPTRAISIRQPYVEAILRGTKRYEFRSRRTRIRERVFLYASLRPGNNKHFEAMGKTPADLPTGVIVGTVDIVACKYFHKRALYGYKLKDPKRLKSVLEPKRKPQPCWFFPFKKKAA